MEPRAWPRLIKNSTRAFTTEARRIHGFSFVDWLHGYVYMRWPYLYIGIGTGEHWTARHLGVVQRWLAGMVPSDPTAAAGNGTFAEDYHGKVVPMETATQLVTVQQDVSLTDLERVIPYSRARDIVLQNPDHIVVLDCPCRVARADPCLPLDVCLIVGEPFASFVKEHHPGRSRWISQGEAIEVLREVQQRGHVSHAFFKDVMLGRFYAICNCCSCCCGAMQYHRLGVPMLASSGYVCQIDADVCEGCGRCVGLCQFGALVMEDGFTTVIGEACMGCGVCEAHCKSGAASLVRDYSRGEPLDLGVLVAQPGAAAP